MSTHTFTVALAFLNLHFCATTYNLSSTNRSPGTDVTIRLSPERNGNLELMVDAEHLPPPGRLGMGLTTYVVWLVSAPDAAPVNIGMLKPGNAQTGWLKTVTAYRQFYLRITAEERGDVQSPSQFAVAGGTATYGGESGDAPRDHPAAPATQPAAFQFSEQQVDGQQRTDGR